MSDFTDDMTHEPTLDPHTVEECVAEIFRVARRNKTEGACFDPRWNDAIETLVTEAVDAIRSLAGEAPGPLAADINTRASAIRRGEPAPDRCTCPEDWQGMDHTSGCKSRASRRPAEPGPTDADMRAFSASNAACYKWPNDTVDHVAARAAYIQGAADYGTVTAEPAPVGEIAELWCSDCNRPDAMCVCTHAKPIPDSVPDAIREAVQVCGSCGRPW